MQVNIFNLILPKKKKFQKFSKIFFHISGNNVLMDCVNIKNKFTLLKLENIFCRL